MFSLCAATAFSVALHQTPVVYEIGVVDLFGQTGLDEAKIRAAIPLRVGDKFTQAQFSEVVEKVATSVYSVLGKMPTDINIVMFDVHGKSMFFVGIPGPSIKSIKPNAEPRGRQTLPLGGLRLYESFSERLSQVKTVEGQKEDDSKGFALFADPSVRTIQLQMRDYAVDRGEAIQNVLKNAASPDERRAASMLLGYATRSSSQISALTDAILDQDETVRNNAIRAISVIARTDPFAIRAFPSDKVIALLASGKWTDRNKSVLLLEELTRNRDPKLLKAIDRGARVSLIECANWTNPPHAYAARIILGRIGGIEEPRLQKLVAEGDVASILAMVDRIKK